MPNRPANQAFSKPALLAILGLIALAVLIVFVVMQVSSPGRRAGVRDPGIVKEEIRQYLREKSGLTNFAASVPPTLLEAGALPSTTGTGPGAKPNLSFPELEATAPFREIMTTGKDWKTLYSLMGQELWVADQLLLQTNLHHQETGTIVATEVARLGLREGIDPWLPARICEAYTLPHMPILGKQGSDRLQISAVGNILRVVFTRASETNNLIRTYELMVEHAEPATADRARFGLVRLLEDQGDYPKALAVLRQVHTTNDGLALRISEMEAKIK